MKFIQVRPPCASAISLQIIRPIPLLPDGGLAIFNLNELAEDVAAASPNVAGILLMTGGIPTTRDTVPGDSDAIATL